MLTIAEIAFTCYPVIDMARARKFYEEVLGLKPSMFFGEPGGMQWTEYDIATGTLALGAGAPDWHPRADGCAVALEVADFDGSIKQLREHKIKFTIEPMETPVCHMAMVSDSEGNTVCIHKRKGK